MRSNSAPQRSSHRKHRFPPRPGDVVGAGSVQELTLIISYEERHVMVYCDRKEVCVNGVWQQTNESRSRTTDSLHPVRKAITVTGNIQAGMGRPEEEHVAEAAGFLRAFQSRVRSLREHEEQLKKYLEECKSGRRG